MSGQTPAGWFPDPQDESQFRYWDGNQWTENQAPRAPQAPMGGQATATVAPPTAPGGAPASGDAPKKNWFLRHKIISGLLALFVIGMIATAASGGGSSSPDTTAKGGGGKQYAAKNKPSAAKPSSNSSNSAENVQGSSAFGSAKLPLQNGDWRLDSIQVKNDGLGDLGGVARITYTGDDQSGGDNLFTVTLFKGKNMVGTLNGSASSVKPGTTATVQLISFNSDKYVPGPYKYDFQNDL